MIDISKLTPAPFTVVNDGIVDLSLFWRVTDSDGDTIAFFVNEADARQCAVARNAFAVMMRRGWHADSIQMLGGGMCWNVYGYDLAKFGKDECFKAMDPFTALVEADKWFKANIEEKQP